MSNFSGNKLKKLRLEKGMTLEELGNKVGVGKSTVRKWETGMIANMRRDKIEKLAIALDVSPLEILGLEEQSAKETQIQKTVYEIPIINDILPQDKIFEDKNILGYFDYYKLPPKNSFAIQIKTDEMNPEILLNDYAIVDPQAELVNNNIVLIKLEEKTLIRIFKKYSNGIYLLSRNTSYEPVFISKDQNNKYIAGKIINIIRDY